MHNETSVEIDRTIEEVFDLTIEHVDQWSIIVIEDVVLDNNPIGVGTTFHTVTESDGKRMEFEGVVTRHDPPHAHAVKMTGKMFDIETEYIFVDLSGRTRVTQTADVSGKGFFKLFMFLFGWMMNRSHCKASEKELNSLKTFCEEYENSDD